MEVKIDSSKMNVVMIGRIMGAVAILVTLVTGLYWWIESGFGSFLSTLNNGLGIGFLVLIATEILNAMQSSKSDGSGDGASE